MRWIILSSVFFYSVYGCNLINCFFFCILYFSICQVFVVFFFVCMCGVCLIFFVANFCSYFVDSSAHFRQPLLRRHHFREQLPPPWISFRVLGLFRRRRLQQRRFLQRLFALRLLEQLLNISEKKREKKNQKQL